MKSTGDNALGKFLRARREAVRPADVGLEESGTRRVNGLRREELAALAGVSTDYYIRLEQGRDRHPSAQVQEALARALMLDEDATAYMKVLAEPPQAPPRRRPRRTEKPSTEAIQVVEALAARPAVIVGRQQQVLAANALASALSPAFQVGVNTTRFVFLSTEARSVYPDWEAVAKESAASLRAATEGDLEDPVLTELVGELSIKSEEFHRLWARHEVRRKSGGKKRFANPLVGELTLDFETFRANGAPDQNLIVYLAAPGSADAERLSLLQSLVAGSASPVPAEASATSDEAPHPVPRR